MTWRKSEEHALETSTFRRFVYGMIRRMAVSLWSGVKWRLTGQRNQNGEVENVDAEPFTGIGFYSKPDADGKPECIMVCVGGAKHTAIVATRDEAVRRMWDTEVADGETAIFTKLACVIVKADGTIHAKSLGGTPQSLITVGDIEAFKNTITSWTPVANDGGAALKTALTSLFSSWPTGTFVLKGE